MDKANTVDRINDWARCLRDVKRLRQALKLVREKGRLQAPREYFYFTNSRVANFE